MKHVGNGANQHMYSDLVISHYDFLQPLAVIELLATSTSAQLNEHFSWALIYAQNLEAWVVY